MRVRRKVLERKGVDARIVLTDLASAVVASFSSKYVQSARRSAIGWNNSQTRAGRLRLRDHRCAAPWTYELDKRFKRSSKATGRPRSRTTFLPLRARSRREHVGRAELCSVPQSEVWCFQTPLSARPHAPNQVVERGVTRGPRQHVQDEAAVGDTVQHLGCARFIAALRRRERRVEVDLRVPGSRRPGLLIIALCGYSEGGEHQREMCEGRRRRTERSSSLKGTRSGSCARGGF